MPRRSRPFGDFLGHHRRAVIGQQSPGQTAFLDRLGESVDQVLGGLREVPLDVAAESRVVIEDAQRDRAQPLAPVGVSTLSEPWWKSRCHSAPTYSAS